LSFIDPRSSSSSPAAGAGVQETSIGIKANEEDLRPSDGVPGGKSIPRSRSRGRRRSRTRQPQEAVVERVVRETAGSGKWPQLTKTNYDLWSLLMKLKLQARCLWDAIEEDEADFHDDSSALEAICSAVPKEMVLTLATKNTAKEA